MEKETQSVLKKHNLSVTQVRVRILEIFLNANGALSHSEIEKAGGTTFDRVTVYRTLQVFEEKGVIHAIPTADNSVRYALCKETCTEQHHHDNHVHFVCNICGKTVCLDNISIPSVKLPEGFLPGQVQMIVNGTCDVCQSLPASSKRRLSEASSSKK